MTQTMRERLIKRAMMLDSSGLSPIGDWHAECIVDAILEELREPDERMVDAGSADASTIPERYAASVAFTAMIDAIRGKGVG